MRNTILALVLTALTLTQMGCATGFRANGPRGNGVSAGSRIGTPPTPVATQRSAAATGTPTTGAKPASIATESRYRVATGGLAAPAIFVCQPLVK
jgi:hypothetical protein